MCAATGNELVHTRARLIEEKLDSNLVHGHHLSEIPSDQGTTFFLMQCLERHELFLGKCLLGICDCHVHSAIQDPRGGYSRLSVGFPW